MRFFCVRCMVYSVRCMVYGVWCTVYGVRCMVGTLLGGGHSSRLSGGRSGCRVYGVQTQKKPPGGDFSELIVSYLAVNRGSFT